MGIKVAGSNPADVLLGVDTDSSKVKYSTDGTTWTDTAGGASVDEIINAVGNYEAQLAEI